MLYNPGIQQFDPFRTFQFYEDFCHGVTVGTAFNADNVFLISQTNGTVALVNSADAGAAGQAALNVTGATANDFCGISLGTNLLFYEPIPKMFFRANFRLLQAAAANRNIRIGFMRNPTATGEVTDGIFIRALGAGNIFGVCRNGGAETTVDFGLAPNTALQPIRFEIAGTVAQGVRFYYGNILRGTITTNLPAAGGGNSFTIAAKYDDTTSGGASGMALDYIFARTTLAGR